MLDGRALARQRLGELAGRVRTLRARGIVPRLEVLVAAHDPASRAYVKMKQRRAHELGIETETHVLDSDWTTARAIDLVRRLDADPAVHGVLVQHPLPAFLDEAAILLALGAAKDVDGMTPQSLGLLASGLPGFRSATPKGIVDLLDAAGIELEGRQALVIGRSVILGKPMALLLLERHATVTIAHSRTRDLPALCREAEVLVAAVGRPEMVRGDWIRQGAVVIDAGYNRVEGRDGDVGDVNFAEAAERAGWITPVPGGVGPMTVASLLGNVVEAAEKVAGGALSSPSG